MPQPSIKNSAIKNPAIKNLSLTSIILLLAGALLLLTQTARAQSQDTAGAAEELSLEVEPQIDINDSGNDGGVIKDIAIIGSQRVEPLTVLNYLGFAVGDTFSTKKARAGLNALYATESFENIALKFDNSGILRVTLLENPTINLINFEGNFQIKDEDLERELTLVPRQVLSRSRVLSEIQRVLAIYRSQGNFATRVVPKIIRLPSNRVNLVFDIEEGASGKIRSIQFVGNKAFSNDTLRSVIISRQARWYTFFATTEHYEKNRISYDAELLRRHYLNNGYLDFRVIDTISELDTNLRDFVITFLIEEGEKYTVNKVALDSSVDDLDLDPIYEALDDAFDEGDTYTLSAIEEFRATSISLMSKQQFFFMEINPRLNKNQNDSSASIVFEIRPGPRAFVERIDIIGNLRTYDRVIRRELRFTAGSPYRAGSIAAARLRLLALDYFSSVDIEQIQGSSDEFVVVVVRVEEKATGSLKLTAGYNSRSGLLASVSYSEKNLLGKGQKLVSNLSLGLQEQSVVIGITEPYFLEEAISFGGDFFWRRTTVSTSSYERRDLGGQIKFGYPLVDNIYQSLAYKVSYTQISGFGGNVSEYVKASNGDFLKGELIQSLSYSNVDNASSPTKGTRINWSIGVSGVYGDISNLQNDFSIRGYIPLFVGIRIQTRNQIGYVFSLNDSPVILADRYFLGGQNLRGFANNGAGPRDQVFSNSLGGKFIWTGSAELIFPLGLPKELGISGAAFFDAGVLLFNPDTEIPSDPILSSSKVRTAAGVGLRWQTLFGPFNFDFAWPITKASHDIPQVFQLGFGVSF